MSWNWQVTPVVAAIIASATLACASDVADTARGCVEAVNDPQQFRIRIVGTSNVKEVVLAQARAEVEVIWRRYQVEIVWSFGPSEMNAAKPDLSVEFVPGLPSHSASAIAWVIFTNGRPLPLARVSVPAATNLLEANSWSNGGPLRMVTVVKRDVALGRIMGRALAHEIGHFMLASRQHRRNGLMRAVIDAEQFVHPDIDRFSLENADVRILRAAKLASCELTRAMPIPASVAVR